MTDHPAYRAILEALVWPYTALVLWAIGDAVRRSVKGDGDNG